MRIATREEAAALGLDWDALMTTAQPAAPAPPAARPGRRRLAIDAQGRNKTEARFGDGYLAGLKERGLILHYAFEPFRLILAGNTTLTLDYVVKRLDGTFALIDVKGNHVEDDAAAKTKVAAREFAWLGDVYLAREQARNSWLLTPVTPLGGIGRVPDLSWYEPRNDGGNADGVV